MLDLWHDCVQSVINRPLPTDSPSLSKGTMAHIRRLSKPPIREAIIEFQIAPLVDIVPEEIFEKWSIAPTYSDTKVQHSFTALFDITQDLIPEVKTDKKTIGGCMLHDTERDIAVQIMQNRLTINKTAPYTNFDELRNEARHFWAQYRTSLRVEQVQRIGLRFINEVVPAKPLQHYILSELLPQGTLPNEAANSYYRYELRRSETLGALVQIVVENDTITSLPTRLILDIDTFSTRAYQASDDAIWEEIVKKLHSLKNELFFAMITEDFAKECE